MGGLRAWSTVRAARQARARTAGVTVGGTGPGRDRGEPSGIDHSISPGVPCPDTVLAVVMSDGSYLLVGYPQNGPAAFVTRDDAGPLRRALQGAFGSPTDDAVGGNGGSDGIAVSGNGAMRTGKVQS